MRLMPEGFLTARSALLPLSSDPSSIVAKGAAEPDEAIDGLCVQLGEPRKRSPESRSSTSIMRSLHHPIALTARTWSLPPQMNHHTTARRS